MDQPIMPQLDLQRGSFLNCPAPAKLNLFLHVTGRRADGYHLLESAFQLLDHFDLLHFQRRADGQIIRCNELAGVAPEADLVVRAARLLQAQTGSLQGAEITLEKKLPMGGGLGGGSSDAATTLIALNQLWNTGLSREKLMQLGLQLGADVPFFLFGENAFAQGIGEQLIRLTTPDCWYVVLEPGVAVATETIFSSKALTRDSPSIKVADFGGYPKGDWRNDLQAVAIALFPELFLALKWLSQHGDARMTGSGSSIFCACDSQAAADNILRLAASEPQWKTWKARALQHHPMSAWLS